MAPARLTLALALMLACVTVFVNALPDKARRETVHEEDATGESEEETNDRPEEEQPHHRHHHQIQDSFSRANAHHQHENADRLKSNFVGGHNHGEKEKSESTGHHARSRPQWNQGGQDIQKANENYMKIRSHAICKVPRPKVIRVKDVYPDTSKGYVPRCTILHRCGDDVGCCGHDTLQCVVKSSETVELYFYTLRMNTDSSTKDLHLTNKVEKIMFINHTECECQMINDDRPRSGSSGTTQSRCPECPSEFSVREHSNGICSCDCFDRQRACLRFKKGRATANETDRRCIESGRCNAPTCEYGHYDVYLGRCPRKHERRSSAYSWWRVDERD